MAELPDEPEAGENSDELEEIRAVLRQRYPEKGAKQEEGKVELEAFRDEVAERYPSEAEPS